MEGRRLRRDRVGHFRTGRLESGGGLLARPALERARDHVGPAGERAFLRLVLLAELEAEADGAQLFDQRAVLLVLEPLDDDLGAVRAESVNLLDLLLRSVEKAVDVAEVARQALREDPAQLGDVEPEKDA